MRVIRRKERSGREARGRKTVGEVPPRQVARAAASPSLLSLARSRQTVWRLGAVADSQIKRIKKFMYIHGLGRVHEISVEMTQLLGALVLASLFLGESS